MNINWYHSKHCKQRIFITSSKYGFYIPIDITIDDYSNDVFYVVKRYSREQDAAKRVNYLNGGGNGT